MGGQQNLLGNMMGGMGSAMNMFGSKGGAGGGGSGTVNFGDGSAEATSGLTNGLGAASSGAAGSDWLSGMQGASGGIGDAAGMMGAAEGGEIPDVATPTVQGVAPVADATTAQGPQSNIGKQLMNSGPKIEEKPSGGGGMNPMNMIGSVAGMGGKAVGGAGNMLGSLGKDIGGHPGDSTFGGGISNGLGHGAGADFLGNVGNMYTMPSRFTGFGGQALNQQTGLQPSTSFFDKKFAEGGKVPVLLSPGERVLSPDKAKAAAKGQANPMAEGKKVPGKPKVAGAKNDYANDTHKDALEPGSIVIPRSVTQGKDAEKASIKFVRAIMARKGHGLK